MWTSAKGAVNAFVALFIVLGTTVLSYREFDSVLKFQPKPIQANTTEAPYYVNIRYGSHERICAGTIISSEWVLTTATCALHKSSADEQLIVSIDQLQPPKLIFVDQIVHEPRFNPDNSRLNDLALLKLASPIQLDKKVTAIRLTKNSAPEIPPGHLVQAASLIVQPDKPDDLMLLVDMFMLPKSICGQPKALTSYRCAYPEKHSPGLCTHEVGGAIVYNGELVGVGVQQDCRSEWFEWYRDLSSEHYIDWINKVAFKSSKSTNFITAIVKPDKCVSSEHTVLQSSVSIELSSDIQNPTAESEINNGEEPVHSTEKDENDVVDRKKQFLFGGSLFQYNQLYPGIQPEEETRPTRAIDELQSDQLL